MDINIILRINPSLKGGIGTITKELGNYLFTIDDEDTSFLHLKKMYLETLFNDEDNITLKIKNLNNEIFDDLNTIDEVISELNNKESI